jgi:hypothetical protein
MIHVGLHAGNAGPHFVTDSHLPHDRAKPLISFTLPESSRCMGGLRPSTSATKSPEMGGNIAK